MFDLAKAPLHSPSEVDARSAGAAMSFRSLMVHVEPSSASDERLRVVVDYAERLSARLIGVGGCAPLYMDDAVAINRDIIDQQERSDLKDSEASFRRIAGSLGDAAEWCSGLGYPEDLMAQFAPAADLILASAHRHADSSSVAAEKIVLTAGIPVLVLPPKPTPLHARRVMVAWKNTREARQAVTAALPLLRDAEVVTVVTAQSYDDDLVGDGLDGIVQRMRRHGVAASGHRIRNGSRDCFETLLNFAANDGAEMIVSGAYGHSRLLEWCIGGVTAGLLDSVTTPIFFSH